MAIRLERTGAAAVQISLIGHRRQGSSRSAAPNVHGGRRSTAASDHHVCRKGGESSSGARGRRAGHGGLQPNRHRTTAKPCREGGCPHAGGIRGRTDQARRRLRQDRETRVSPSRSERNRHRSWVGPRRRRTAGHRAIAVRHGVLAGPCAWGDQPRDRNAVRLCRVARLPGATGRSADISDSHRAGDRLGRRCASETRG